MKILRKDISAKDGEGTLRIQGEDEEDMWHAYNLIMEGDLIRASTVRKVVKESSTGSVQSEKKRITLTLEVEGVDFDGEMGVVRVKGRNTEENVHVKLGAYHTIDLEMNHAFTVRKQCWDAIFLERLEAASDPTGKADLAAVVMGPGLAHLCLITGHMTMVRSKIEKSIPKKRAGSSGHAKAMIKFYEQVLQALERHIRWDVVKCIVISSPGFLKDDFFKYLMEQARKRDLKQIVEFRDRFLLAHASSGHKHALNEVMAEPGIAARLADTKATGEVRLLEEFMQTLNSDPDRACYSYKHCVAACSQGAVKMLLVTDGLFRSVDLRTRKLHVALVEDVKAAGGGVTLFSSMHISGEQLEKVSGVAALLRFPIPESEGDSDSDTSEIDDDTDVPSAGAGGVLHACAAAGMGFGGEAEARAGASAKADGAADQEGGKAAGSATRGDGISTAPMDWEAMGL